MTNFINNIALADGKWRKKFQGIWLTTGVLLGIYITDFTQWSNVIFFVTYVLGLLCVTSLADRSPKSGNFLGLASNVGEVFTNFTFGNFGLAFAGIYYGITHILGLFTWTKKENQDNDGRIKTEKMNTASLLLTGLFIVGGIILMMRFGGLFGITKEGNVLFYYLNIIAFVVGIISQLLMILRKPISWWGWFITNFIWFYLDFASGNTWFAVRDVFYQINVALAIYAWYYEENKNSRNNLNKVN